ncbi:MAG: hypothetical protein HQ549_04560 [Candidatus Omnitrophica bacterium]|nr:hypothetical protein [Candidatus Omnitrophota bacterium]
MKKILSGKQKILAMIPARMGSTRLSMKNLALINKKPLIYYAVGAAKASKIFDDIIINSEDGIFKKIAARYKVKFYKRPIKLGGSSVKSDMVVYDFIKKNPCDIVVWVNTIAPLQVGEEIKNIVKYFVNKKLDSLITVKDERVHCIYKGKPVNFKKEATFAKTQDLLPVQPFVYSVMMWRTDVFMSTFKKKGHALFCGKTAFYPVSKLSTFIIKRKEDLALADFIMRAMKKRYRVCYDKVLKNRRTGN